MDRTGVKWPKWALAVLFLVDGAGFGTWAAHVPVFKQFLHIENGSLTFVLISVIAGAIISMPVTGQLIARYGSRRVIRNAAISYVLMIGLLAQASSFWLLVIFAGLFGAAKGAFDISVNAQAMAVEKHYQAVEYEFLPGLLERRRFAGCWCCGPHAPASRHRSIRSFVHCRRARSLLLFDPADACGRGGQAAGSSEVCLARCRTAADRRPGILWIVSGGVHRGLGFCVPPLERRRNPSTWQPPGTLHMQSPWRRHGSQGTGSRNASAARISCMEVVS